MKKQSIQPRTLVGLALLTSLVVVFQLLGNFIHIGPMALSLVQVPIIIGAALYGPWAGMWLGGTFSVVLLVSPDAALFMGFNPVGTVVTILLRGLVAGFLAGLTYKAVKRASILLGAVLAGIVYPVVNTGLFALGMRIFLWDAVASLAGEGASAVEFLFISMIGLNFFVELGINMVLTPVIVRLIEQRKKTLGGAAGK